MIFVTQVGECGIVDGDIRLVIGVDKVSIQGIATFFRGARDSRLEIKVEDNSRGGTLLEVTDMEAQDPGNWR